MKGTHKLVAGIAVVTCAAAAVLVPRVLSGSAGASELSTTSSATSTASSTKNHVDNPFEVHSALGRKTNSTDNSLHLDGRAAPTHFQSAARAASSEARGDFTLPASVDLRAYAMPVANQGQVQSCVTWAIDYAMLGWYSNKAGRSTRFAPMYTYSQINGGVDKGSDPAQALSIAENQGSDTRSDYTQGDYDWQTKPTAAETANASHYKITGWQRLFEGQTGQGQLGINAVKNVLANGKPVSFGVPHRAGLNMYGGKTLDTDNTSSFTGYHEMLALGYDATGMLFQNSWGPAFGDNGFGRLAWNVVGTDVLDAWTISGLASDATTTNTNTNTNTATKPVMNSTVSVAVAKGYQVSNVIPEWIHWTPASGNVARYSLYTSTNGGQWADTTSRLSTTNATSVVLNLVPGNNYRFAVAGIDAAGNKSDWVYSATVNTKIFDDTQFNFSSGWKRYNWTSAVGGQGVTTSNANETAATNITGRGVSIIAPTFSTAGQMQVFVDNKLVQTVNLATSTLNSGMTVFSWYWPTSGTHNVTLKTLGGRVDVDAIAVIG